MQDLDSLYFFHFLAQFEIRGKRICITCCSPAGDIQVLQVQQTRLISGNSMLIPGHKSSSLLLVKVIFCLNHPALAVGTPASYSRVVAFFPRPETDCTDWDFHRFPQCLQAYAGILPQIRICPLPSTSFAIHYLILIL